MIKDGPKHLAFSGAGTCQQCSAREMFSSSEMVTHIHGSLYTRPSPHRVSSKPVLALSAWTREGFNSVTFPCVFGTTNRAKPAALRHPEQICRAVLDGDGWIHVAAYVCCGPCLRIMRVGLCWELSRGYCLGFGVLVEAGACLCRGTHDFGDRELCGCWVGGCLHYLVAHTTWLLLENKARGAGKRDHRLLDPDDDSLEDEHPHFRYGC